MSLLFCSFSANLPVHGLILKRNFLSNSSFFRVDLHTSKKLLSLSKNICPLTKKKPSFIPGESISSTDAFFGEEDSFTSFDLELRDDEGETNDLESPWEGAIIYQRNPSISHIEYCTTLERLGMGELSTETSKSRASVMGLRVTKAVKDFPTGSPVLISIEVTRKKRRLRLDGIVRTVITLACNRCGEPTAESIFSNISLLLTEAPVEEPDIIDLGVMYGEDKNKAFGSEDEGDDEALIDFDDRLHFPSEEKVVDISKQIRDLLHVEITFNSVCDTTCKGLCLYCGSNLNTTNCKCSKDVKQTKGLGPLKDLKKQMQNN